MQAVHAAGRCDVAGQRTEDRDPPRGRDMAGFAGASRVLERGGRLCAAIPHPVYSAGSFQAREANAPFVIDGSYLDQAAADWVSDRDGIRMIFHSEHRPLEAYSRALETAGLLIEAIREARVPDEVVRDNPNSRRWQRIPLFLHLRAVKP